MSAVTFAHHIEVFMTKSRSTEYLLHKQVAEHPNWIIDTTIWNIADACYQALHLSYMELAPADCKSVEFSSILKGIVLIIKIVYISIDHLVAQIVPTQMELTQVW